MATTDIYQPRPARASQLWLLVILAVLAVLFIETRSTSRHNSNLFLNGDSDSVGATVLIDGMSLGKIKSANNSGLSGGAFWCHLHNGPHLLEVRKNGFKSYSTLIDFKGQEYIGINLEPTTIK